MTAVAVRPSAAASMLAEQPVALPPADEEWQPEAQRPAFDSSRYTLHSQGAEARVWQGTFLGRPTIAKERFHKRYRHPQLEARLAPARLKSEVRSMLRARKLGVRTPVLYHVDQAANVIFMELVPGQPVKTLLKSEPRPSAQLSSAVMQAVGQAVAHMHDGGLVHGDLTTSNLLVHTCQQQHGQQQPLGQQQQGLRLQQQDHQQQQQNPDIQQEEPRPDLIVIDFGLAYNSTIPEDKAVDLYVLERAFTAAHAETGGKLFEQVLTAYRKTSKFWSATLNRFAEVRTRGRKRTMVG